MKTQKFTFEFQAYEIENIKKALEVMAKDIESKSNDSYRYTQGWQKSEKYLSQIAFTLKSIERQMQPKENMCRIYGSEIPFELFVAESDFKAKIADICLYPEKYYSCGENAYYSFLKFLWVNFPNGKNVQLADYANENGIL